MWLQGDEAQHQECRDGHAAGGDLMDFLLAAADRALALGNRYLAVLLINEIYKSIDEAD